MTVVSGVFPPEARIMLVGEAPGDEEVERGVPFVGPSGRLLDALLRVAGVDRSTVAVTNVFDVQLPGNDVEAWCGQAAERATWPGYAVPPLDRSQNICPEHVRHLERLFEEINHASPNVIVALGGTALWALTGAMSSEITRRRGAVTSAMFGERRIKVIPTFHPAFVLQKYKMFHVVASDLLKAVRESAFPEVRTTRSALWVEPTLDDIRTFKQRYLDNAERISIDIETIPKWRQITCIGFAPGPAAALCIPFVDGRRPGRSYWPDVETEVAVWRIVREICESPVPKLGQNFTYDFQWLWTHGIAVRNYCEDTRLMHHALYPELPKDLGFMGATYANRGAWKTMRAKTEKRDD